MQGRRSRGRLLLAFLLHGGRAAVGAHVQQRLHRDVQAHAALALRTRPLRPRPLRLRRRQVHRRLLRCQLLRRRRRQLRRGEALLPRGLAVVA